MSGISRPLLTVPVLAVLACQFNLDGIPTARPSTAQPRDAAAPSLESGVDARVAEPWAAGLRHASCDRAVPADVPTEPTIASDPFGRPLFDAWRLIACAEVAAFPTCGQYDGNDRVDCTQCLGAADHAAGICASLGLQQRDFCVPLHDRIRNCWACVTPEAKARACCAGLDVDCHSVSDGPGAPGEVCRRHMECQPGLVCVDTFGVGAAICACPGPLAGKPELGTFAEGADLVPCQARRSERDL